MKKRGFEHVQEKFRKYNCGGLLPLRGTRKSAGYDFYAPQNFFIEPGEKVTIWTNIKAYMLDSEALKIYIRSSKAIKESLILMNQVGIIDCDYYNNPDNDGNIGICVYNWSDSKLVISAGERIAQGIFQEFLESDNGNTENDRIGGVGSTN